jgi:hypothetical protein
MTTAAAAAARTTVPQYSWLSLTHSHNDSSGVSGVDDGALGSLAISSLLAWRQYGNSADDGALALSVILACLLDGNHDGNGDSNGDGNSNGDGDGDGNGNGDGEGEGDGNGNGDGKGNGNSNGDGDGVDDGDG